MSEPGGPARAIRVLVVDDDEAQRHMLAAVLRAARHEVATAATIPAAAEALAAGFDVALVDLTLGGEDGLAFATVLARRHPGVVVVASTGHSRPARLPAGIHAWLEKPYPVAELVATIAALTSRLQRLAVDDEDRAGRVDAP